ncbi:MAG TPA: hypothetical protein VFA45_12295 [Actinomycetes bacterium]|nr:hypothetical protein [Actinomycetes bacterium]
MSRGRIAPFDKMWGKIAVWLNSDQDESHLKECHSMAAGLRIGAIERMLRDHRFGDWPYAPYY